jgi:hypothetical protein
MFYYTPHGKVNHYLTQTNETKWIPRMIVEKNSVTSLQNISKKILEILLRCFYIFRKVLISLFLLGRNLQTLDQTS